MKGLTIRLNSKAIFDSQGSTLTTDGCMDVISTVLGNMLNGAKDHQILISIRPINKDSVEQAESNLQPGLEPI